jgi:hypothetical protein
MIAAAPLEGLRVLDFTHVLAGPRSARTLAEYGADVLHISTPSYPDTFAQHLAVDVGKRCAYLDLRQEADLAALREVPVPIFQQTVSRPLSATLGASTMKYRNPRKRSASWVRCAEVG